MATVETTTGMYVCGICKAEYSRSDHLIRHVRGHTKQRPFVCSVCGKGFGRQDLLKRHLTTHDGGTQSFSGKRTENVAHSGRYSHRVHQACHSCAVKKLKCTDEKPCKRCREKNIQCDYEEDLGNFDLTNTQTADKDPIPEAQSPEQSSLMAVDLSEQAINSETASVFDFSQKSRDTTIDTYALTGAQTDMMMPPQDSFVQDILGSTLGLPDIGDFIQLDSDPMLEDMDFSFLNNVNTPMAPSPPPAFPSIPLSPVSNPTPQSSMVGVGTEAYRQSEVLNDWEPGGGDNNESEHQNLVLPQNIRPGAPSRSSVTKSITRKDLSLAMRDRILAMILRTTSTTAADNIVGSFPSVEVLRDLIHIACLHMRDKQVISFIHMPSFDLNEQRPELVGAFIAYGSVCSPSPTVRKFGYALQEAVRAAINQLVEKQHTTLRELGVTQAFYIQLFLGYYSGVSRKIELAECNSMLGATVIRRGRMQRAHSYSSPETFLNMPGLSLQEKWIKWAEQESRKRLVCFAVAMDAHISVSRKISLLFPYAEMEIPLPTATRLWTAETASRWLEILMSDVELRVQQPPSLYKCLRQPRLITNHKSIIDVTTSAVIFLAGFWAFVYEYRQMSAVLPPAQSWNDFVLNSRHTDLTSTLESFKADLSELDIQCPKVWILQDYLSLHLNVSFYDISDYSGRGTEEDARLAMPYVQRWYESPQSRIAIWHAGQIFRATKLLGPGHLADIYAIALYHAAVILWVWGLVKKTQGPWSGLELNGHRAVLDGEETLEVSRFLKAFRNTPGLTGPSGNFIPLEEPALIPDLANVIVMANWSTEQPPLTTEEVSRLMQGFASISRQRFATRDAGDDLYV